MRRRTSLRGVEIDRVTLDDAVNLIDGFVEGRTPRHVVTVNVDYLRLARADKAFLNTLAAADLAVADGMPLVWASRLVGEALPERVTGVDLTVRCAALAARKGYSLFFLGAGPGVARDAARVLRSQLPALRIAGTYAPSMGNFGPQEERNIIEMLRVTAPDILFVAFGAPRQDTWVHKRLPELGVPVVMGVGCTFDIISGQRSRAPRWMRGAGLEWAYRLLREPGRLWTRYLLRDLPVFLQLMTWGATRRPAATARRFLPKGANGA